jgi:hypothetical protein
MSGLVIYVKSFFTIAVALAFAAPLHAQSNRVVCDMIQDCFPVGIDMGWTDCRTRQDRVVIEEAAKSIRFRGTKHAITAQKKKASEWDYVAKSKKKEVVLIFDGTGASMFVSTGSDKEDLESMHYGRCRVVK